MVITSSSNEQIKRVIRLKEKAKERHEKKLFTVEGIKMFSEVPENMISQIFVSETFEREKKDLLDGKKYLTVSDGVFKKMSDTVTPQGVLVVVKQPEYSVDYIIKNRNRDKSCIVVLDRVQDPGNLGTIIRTGEGAGISGIIMSAGCADIYNPKVIRSTMGSIFRMKFAVSENLTHSIEQLKKAGVTVYAAHLKGQVYSSSDIANDCAFLMGNESGGLSDGVAGAADRLIKIPMKGKVESLNVAVATAILMYETART